MYPKEESPIPLSPDFLRRATTYAGIGSRSTPVPILALISQIAGVLANYGLILRSGGASGADTAFEAGCDHRHGKKEIFLPWEGFNRNPSPLSNPPAKAEEIASKIHPNWRAVKPKYRAFHARNVQQVLGVNLDVPVDFVIFYAPETYGRVEGGTATAVGLARELQIPAFNLWDDDTQKEWEQLVKDHQQRNKNFWSRIFRGSNKPPKTTQKPA